MGCIQKVSPLKFLWLSVLIFWLHSKGNQASLARIHFSHPESEGKSADVGGGGQIGILTNLLRKNQSFSQNDFQHFSAVDTQTAIPVSTAKAWISAQDT